VSARPESILRAVAVLGHELRNPLASAATGAALVAEMVDADDPRRPVVDSVMRSLQRVSALLDGYLGFLRSGEPERKPVSLRLVGQQVASGRKGVVLAVQSDAVAVGDAELLVRVAENLVDNAFQVGATQVTLRGRKVGDEVELAIEDNGPGVPEELRQQIFEPGFSKCGSSGLGLSIVKETIDAHGGRIQCEPGATGARFCIRLQAADVATVTPHNLMEQSA
jgi:signal transduction histidine kinase